MAIDHHRLNELSERIIATSYKVANTLGPGFLEGVYENAMAHELNLQKLRVAQQQQLLVRYDGVVVGEFRADLVVEDRVLLEIKAVTEITKAHEAQIINYLKAAKIKLGLILSFGGTSVQINRKVNGF